MIGRYRVLESNNGEALAAQVNKALDEGYVLHGDLKVVNVGGCRGGTGIMYYQSVYIGELSARILRRDKPTVKVPDFAKDREALEVHEPIDWHRLFLFLGLILLALVLALVVKKYH